jgi:hypothetical protein
MVEPVELLQLADELVRRAEGNPRDVAQAVLAAHAALEATVNRLGGVEIQSFNYRARFLPKLHDLCQRVLGRQLEAAPDLERLQAVRDAVVGYRGEPERLDRRAITPPPEVPTDVANPQTARWAVETARRVIREFHEASGREVPSWAWNELVTRAQEGREAVVMQGVYRVWHGGRELLESFVAAPGPMGWRYFGRVHPPDSEEELFTVDYVVDAEWGLLRYRLLDQSGTRIVATPATGGVEVVTGRPGDERTETMAGASAVWSSSP